MGLGHATVRFGRDCLVDIRLRGRTAEGGYYAIVAQGPDGRLGVRPVADAAPKPRRAHDGLSPRTTVLRRVFRGTDLDIVQEGIPEVIPPVACYLGWQQSLVLLGLLIEGDLPA